MTSPPATSPVATASPGVPVTTAAASPLASTPSPAGVCTDAAPTSQYTCAQQVSHYATNIFLANRQQDCHEHTGSNRVLAAILCVWRVFGVCLLELARSIVAEIHPHVVSRIQ